MSSSFGPVNPGRPKQGECRYCWDENHTRLTGTYFESRVRMVGPTCRHRLLPAKSLIKQFQSNAFHTDQRRKRPKMKYWGRRAKYLSESFQKA